MHHLSLFTSTRCSLSLILSFVKQRRIVAKVDQLMPLCDELEAKLDQSQTDGAKLMGAVVAELVGA
jgi:type I restriction enzyme S subunit